MLFALTGATIKTDLARNGSRHIIITGKCLLICAILAIGVPAAGIAQKTDAETLAENMPAIQLWSDAELSLAYKPYFDCFAYAVGNGRGSTLENDANVSEASNNAQALCAEQKGNSTLAADRYLASIKPALSDEDRSDLLTRYRRQMGFFAVAQWYKSNGRVTQFQGYIKRTGRSAKQGQLPLMLNPQ